MFQVVARHWKLIFFLFTSPKFDLGEVEKAMFHVLACHFELILGLLTIQNATLLRSRKRSFKGTHVTFNQFSASGPT